MLIQFIPNINLRSYFLSANLATNGLRNTYDSKNHYNLQHKRNNKNLLQKLYYQNTHSRLNYQISIAL